MKIKLLKKKSVNSTNDLAIKLIKKNILKPTLITSLIQKKGRGRMGKKWISQKGNLFISIFFEIDPRKLNFKQYAILNANLIKNAISKYSTEKINIKWPNDLLIGDKKICGILQETIDFKEKKFIIIGVGINTNSSPIIKNFRTISLKDMLKRDVNNNNVIQAIKKIYEKFIKDIESDNFSNLKKKISINK